MDLRGRKLSDTYTNLLSTGPLASDQTITLGNGAVVPWEANGIVVAGGTANQTIGGSKTFNGTLTVPSTLNFASNGSIVKAGNHAVTLTTSSASNITFSSPTAFTYTVPNPGTNASFVMTEGAQTINGAKTFNGDFTITNSIVSIAASATATNLILRNTNNNYWGSSVTGFNTFGDRVTGLSAYNEFGHLSRLNIFGAGSRFNYFGNNATGFNHFGAEVSGASAYNEFGTDLKSGAKNNFGRASKNYFGENGENYFYSGLFAGPVTMPSSGINFTNAGSIVKAGNHALGFTTTAGTTGTLPTGNITIAALEGTQTFAGEKTFTSGVNILKTTDQLVLGNTTKLTISSTAPASNRRYIIPDAGKDVNFILSSGTQTIEGTTTFISTINASITGNAGTVTNGVYTSGNQIINGVKDFSSRLTVNGSGVLLSGDSLPGTYTSYKLTFGSGIKGQPFTWNGNQDKTVEIDTTNVAVLTGNQTIDGTKTFNNGIIINTVSNQLQLGTTNKLTITTNPAASRTYTIPDVGGNADFVMTSGSQNIAGTKTFASQIIIETGSNQLVLRTGSAGSNSFTISAPTISGNRTYTIPDVSGNSSFVMTTGTQDIGGSKNFTTRPTINGVNVLLSGDTTAFTRVEATNLVYNTGDQIISGRKRFRNASVVPYGPFVNDVDADFNGLLSSREIYFTNDGNTRSAIEIPTLDMVYETGATTLTPRIGPTPTFTRTQTNTSGSYLASDGFIKYLAADQPRFDYAVSKNLLPNSKDFSEYERYPQYYYGANDDRIMVQPYAEVNPFKSLKDAAKIIDITGNSTNYDILTSTAFVSGLTYTMSAFVKPINNNFVRLHMTGPNAVVLYNLSNGSISGVMGSIVSSGIDNSYGNGWSRIWLSATHNQADGNYQAIIKSSNLTGANAKTVTTKNDAYYLWGPQVEIGSLPTQYQESIGGWSVNAYSRRTPKGLLLEKESNNFILNSNTFTGSNAGGATVGNIQLTGGVWPDSSVSGSVLVETNTTAFQGIYRDAVTSITSGTNYVSSIFLKQPVSGSITGRRYVLGRFITNGIIPDTRVVIDLDSGISGGRTMPVAGYTAPTFYTGIRYPNNWYRLVIGQRATGTTGSGGSFFVYSTTGFGIDGAAYSGLNGPGFQMFGHQIETAVSGDGATSYKPTSGLAGTLGRDVISIGGSDFNSFYNQSEGTFFFEGECLQPTANEYKPMFAINSTANRGSGSVDIARSSTTYQVNFVGSGLNQWSNGAQFLKTTGNLFVPIVASYKENNFNASFYNETIQKDTSGNVGISRGALIFGTNGGQTTNMYLQRFSYWPLQFQDSKLTGIYRY